MTQSDKDFRGMRILYSFPWVIGEFGIGYTAWEQVNQMALRGANITLFAGRTKHRFEANLRCHFNTMSLVGIKIPAKVFGGVDRAAAYHDQVVAKFIKKNSQEIDVLHCWPLASELSIRQAKSEGIRTFLERPNAHTEFAYTAVNEVYSKFGLENGSSFHVRDNNRLSKEIKEYECTDYLLCPSSFVIETFERQGFSRQKLLRHQYGYSPQRIVEVSGKFSAKFKMVFIGNDGARKGLHTILEAWNLSSAKLNGELHVYGKMDPFYINQIKHLLSYKGVIFHGFTKDVAAVLAESDILVLSSYEEGSALVTYEGVAAGCALLVSSATGAPVTHGINGLVHSPGNVQLLSKQIDSLYSDNEALELMKKNSLNMRPSLTWEQSAIKLLDIYEAHL